MTALTGTRREDERGPPGVSQDAGDRTGVEPRVGGGASFSPSRSSSRPDGPGGDAPAVCFV